MDSYSKKYICVIADNDIVYSIFKDIAKKYNNYFFDYFYSWNNRKFENKYKDCDEMNPIRLNTIDKKEFEKYDVIFSVHCKQIFPAWLTSSYRCINFHPGFNPYNRGWFPEVFSIINNKPVGVTVHSMNSDIDGGPIIYQEKVEVREYDTAFDVYKKIISLEEKILKQHLKDLIEENYQVFMPKVRGNINTKKEFEKLCSIDLDQVGTFREFYNILRATTFAGYDNLYFTGKDNSKNYISISIHHLENE